MDALWIHQPGIQCGGSVFQTRLIITIMNCSAVVMQVRTTSPPAKRETRLIFKGLLHLGKLKFFEIVFLTVQWEQNQGRCGVCGDPWNMEEPRLHEAGGQYAKGIISRHYSVGQEIDVEIELTANHWGRFEINLCPNNNPRYEASQECFDR